MLTISISMFMLFYLALAMPYIDNLQNFQEILNEVCLYFILLFYLSVNTFHASIKSDSLDSLVGWIILFICLTVMINIYLLIYSLYQPFKESLKDRESTSIGRCLRYCFKIKLPESSKCFCDCCTCGDEAKEVASKYERSSFFSI